MNFARYALGAAVLCTLVTVPVFIQAQTPRTANLGWGTVTKDVEGNTITGVTYKVYQGPKGGTKTAVRTGLTSTTLALSGLAPGETCWQVSANAAGGESALSNEACKSFPLPVPATTTLVVD